MATRAEKVDSPEKGANRRSLPDWLRTPGGMALVVSAFLACLAMWAIWSELGQPFGGYVSYSFTENRPSIVASETPAWWPVLATRQLTLTDTLVAIDGQPYMANARRVYAAAAAEGRMVTVLAVNQETGVERLVTIEPTPITAADIVDVKLPESLIAIAFWLLALLVLRARPASITNQVFAIAASAVAIHRAVALPSLFFDGQLLQLMATSGHLITAGLIGPLLVHLALVFPTPLPRQRPRLLRTLYALGLASGVVGVATRLPWVVRVPLPVTLAVDDGSYLGMLLLLLAGVVALFSRLVWSWFNERRTRRQRRATLIILLGLLTALPRVVIMLLPLLRGLDDTIGTYWQGLDLRYLLLAIPIAFAFVIIRYQTFQALSALFILVLVLSISGALAAIGAWGWQILQPPGLLPTRPPFALLFVFIFLGSALWTIPLSRGRGLGRMFHWEAITYDAARMFGRRAMDATDARELPAVLTQALVEEMALERAALWLRGDGGRYALVGSAGDAGMLPRDLAGPTAHETFPERALPGQPPEQLPAWLCSLGGEGRAEVVIPLSVEGQPLGLLGLGRRWDEAIFDRRDLAMADLVGQQATLLLRAAMQMEELRRVPGQVAEAQERERLRVAGELHDTIQQFLGRLPFFLAVSRNSLSDDPQAAADILDRCLTDVEDAAAMLRRIRVNLAPNLLETNLLRSLNGLVAHVGQRSGMAVTLSAPDDLDSALKPETRHALYRVIQQALDNTTAHAEATTADVLLARLDGRVVFSVRDNGHGSTAEQRRSAEAAGSYGLRSMRARLEMCGGYFALESEPGQGTTVRGWVPATDE
ncbi:MAG TPA: histidine kinase [Promineifilum sp.]|nr:histidine kinase [Promineifilum sp.]